MIYDHLVYRDNLGEICKNGAPLMTFYEIRNIIRILSFDIKSTDTAQLVSRPNERQHEAIQCSDVRSVLSGTFKYRTKRVVRGAMRTNE